jgi:hypothetical protein
LNGAGDLADQDAVCAGGRHGLDTGGEVGRSGWREAAKTIERVELELRRDLRPPRAVLDQEMCVEPQPARARDQLDVVKANAAITPFPPCDRGLAEAETFGQYRRVDKSVDSKSTPWAPETSAAQGGRTRVVADYPPPT